MPTDTKSPRKATAAEEHALAHQRALNEPIKPKPKPADRKPTQRETFAASGIKDQAVKVLRDAKGPLHNRELADRIKKRFKREVAYDPFYLLLKGDESFVKTEPARFDLKELNPKGKALRPGQTEPEPGGPQRAAAKPEAKKPTKAATKAKAKSPSKAKAKTAQPNGQPKSVTTPVKQREEALAGASA